jgi:hypothetical protein
MRPVDISWIEKFPVCHIGVITLELTVCFDLFILADDPGRVAITFAVYESQNGHALFPAVLSS